MNMLDRLCDTRNAFEAKAISVALCLILAFSFINFSAFAEGTDESSSNTPVAQSEDVANDEVEGSTDDPAPVETPAAAETLLASDQPEQNETPVVEAPVTETPVAETPAQGGGTESEKTTESTTDVRTAEPGVAVVDLSFEHAYIEYLGQTIGIPTETVNAPLNKELVFTVHADEDYEVGMVKSVVNGREAELSVDEATGQCVVPADLVTSNLTIAVVAQEKPADEGVVGSEGAEPAAESNAAVPFGSRAAKASVVNVAVGESFTIEGSGAASDGHEWYMSDPDNPSDLLSQNIIKLEWDEIYGQTLSSLGLNVGSLTVNHRWGTADQWGVITNVKGTESFTVNVEAGSGDASNQLSLSPSSVTISQGETETLKAVLGSGGKLPNLKWSSSDSKVARVKNGVVTGVGPGSATITASVPKSGMSARATVTVVPAVTNVESIAISGASEVAVGESTQLSATVETTDGEPASQVKWRSSNPSAATVDENGVVTGVLGGSTVISASLGGVTAQHVVQVVAYTISFYSNYPDDAKKYAIDGTSGLGDIVSAENTYAVYQLAPTEHEFTAIEGFNSANYAFTGWNTKPDGSGSEYQPGAAVPVEENIQLFAQWEGPHKVEQVNVTVVYHNDNTMESVFNHLRVPGIRNADGSVTFQLHKQEVVGANNPNSTLRGWVVGSPQGEEYPMGSVCTTSTYESHGNEYAVHAYAVHGSDVVAEFFVLKPTVTDLSGNINAVGNYFYAGTGVILPPADNSTIDYKTNAFENVNEYIKTAPSPSAIADKINIGIDQAQSIRWYKIIHSGSAWHVDGMLYTVGKYWNVNYYDGGQLVKTELVQDGGGFDILGSAPAVPGDDFDSWRYANGTEVTSEAVNVTGNINVYSKYRDHYNIIALIDDGGTAAPASQQVLSGNPSNEVVFTASEGYQIESITETTTDVHGGGKVESTIDVGDRKTYVYPSIQSVDKNHTIVVTTKVDTFSVVYNLDGGVSTSPFLEFSDVEYGTATPTIDDPSKTGYTFAGWDKEVAATVTGDVTYTAQWARDDSQARDLSYTVEYYKNGVVDETKTATVTKPVWVNDTMIPVEQNEVNVTDAFGSYYRLASTDPDPLPVEVAEGTVLKVYYEGVEDSLAYHGNGALSGSVDATKGIVGGKVSVAANGFVRAGYTFEGWNTQADGAGVTYEPGDEFELTTGEDLLYAQWTEAAPVGLIYRADAGGRVTAKDGSAVSTWSEAVKPATGTPTGSMAQPSVGYRFEGWFVNDVQVSSEALLSKDVIDRVAVADGAYVSTTFVAKFVESEDVTLSYVSGMGGSVSSPSEMLPPATGAAAGSTAIPDPGYSFIKWTAIVSGTQEDVSAEETLTPEAVNSIAKKTGIYEATTFTAHFEENSAFISYVADENGRVTHAGETVGVVNGKPQGSTAQAADKYYFKGWSVGDSDDIVSEETTLSKAIIDQYAKSDGLFVPTTFTARFEEKRKITIESKSDDKVYDGVMMRVDDTEIRGADNLTVEGVEAYVEETDAGEYPVEFYNTENIRLHNGFKDVTYQYEIELIEGTMLIEKRPITITGDGWSQPQQFTGSEYAKNSYTFDKQYIDGKNNGLVYGQTLELTYNIAGTDVGNYVGTFEDDLVIRDLTRKDVTSNYVVTKVAGKLSVVGSEKPLVITAASHEWKYDGADHEAPAFAVKFGDVEIQPDSAGKYFLPTGDEVTAKVSGSVRDVADTAEGNNEVVDYAVENAGRYANVSTVPGTLTVTPRSVELTSATVSKQYDGTPLTAQNVQVTGDGWVEPEGATYNVTGSRTAVGSVDNSFDYVLNEGTSENNYVITKHVGTLTVEGRADTARFEITVQANSGDFTYDGDEKTVSGLQQTQFTFGDATFTVSGLEANASGTDADTYVVNVVGTPVVTDEEGNDVTDQFVVHTKNDTLTIAKRAIVLESASAQKPYDGTPLKNSTVTVVSGEFAPGEGATYNVTGSQTTVGFSPNTYTYALTDATKAKNYDIDTHEGTLTVTNRDAKYEVAVYANSGDFTYDGTEKSVSGFVGETDRGIPVEADGHTYYVTGLIAGATGTNVADSATIPVSGAPRVWDGEGNDVSSQFNVSAAPGQLAIGKRSVTLASQSLSKEYDGTPLRNGDEALAEKGETDGDAGWAPGEGASYRFTKSVTLPGATAPNEFEVVPNQGTDLSNYEVKRVFGTLSVTSRTAKYEVELQAESGDFTYDGAEKSVSGFVGEVGGAVPVQVDGQTYYVSGLKSQASGTQADVYQTVVEGTAVVLDAQSKDVSSQFNVSAAPGQLAIGKRSVTLASQSLSKEYDGTPLRNGDEALAEKGETDGDAGWAPGEGASYRFTKSVTLPGATAPNEFEVVPNQGTDLANYEVKPVFGTLSVTSRTAKYEVELQAESGDFTYDGAEKSVSGFVGEVGGAVPVQVDGQTYYVSGLKSQASGSAVADSVATVPVEGVAVVKDAQGNVVSDQFNVTVNAGTFTINPAELVIVADDSGKRYGEADPALSATVIGLVPGDTFDGTYKVSRAAGENAGTYEIVVDEVRLADQSNYTATTAPGRFVITPADEVTLIVSSGSKPYDGTPLTPSGFTPVGLAPGDTVEAVYGGSQIGAGVSEGTITDFVIRNAAGEDVTANYPKVNVVPGELAVSPAVVTITVDDASKVAGAGDPVFTGTVEGLVAAGDLGEIAYHRSNADEAAGVYADVITAVFTANPNYTVKVVPGTFVITAAPIAPTVPVTPTTPPTPATPTPNPLPQPAGTVPAGPLAPVIAPVVEALQGAVETVIPSDATPLAGPQEETIADDGTPLAGFDQVHCWVHYYLILGIVLTVLYGAVVLTRRIRYTHKLKNYEDEVLGIEDEQTAVPAAAPLVSEG